ncbi:MAG: gliding motility-associated C-terminal domain-containing protein, partial [Bacteroidota bacterium]
LEIGHISCFGANDGFISILEIQGGIAPYQPLLNGVRISNGIFSDLTPGEYQLEIFDANGCSSITFIEIVEPEELSVRLTSEIDLTAVPTGTEVDLVARIFGGSTIDTIIWAPDSVGVISGNRMRFTARVARTIEVTVIDEEGCRISDRINVSVVEPPPVYIPNAFSPNGDNVNDRWFIQSNPGLVDYVERLEVYDRWGERVYEAYDFPADDPRFGWDGFLDGRPMNPAVFVYQTYVRLFTGETLFFSGEVVLVK